MTAPNPIPASIGADDTRWIDEIAERDAVETEAQSYLAAMWRWVPSANILDRDNRKPVRWTILSEGKWGSENTPVSIAGDLCEESAARIVQDHNALLRAIPELRASQAREKALREALVECIAVLTDPIVGTIYHDEPRWYQALDKAVAKARASLTTGADNG